MRVPDPPNFPQINPNIVTAPIGYANKSDRLNIQFAVSTKVTSVHYTLTGMTAYFELIAAVGGVISFTTFLISNALKPY